MIDRVLSHYDNPKIIGRQIKGTDTKDLLNKLRKESMNIVALKKQRKIERLFVIVACGMNELKGGGSSKWNKIHLESIFNELELLEVDKIFINPQMQKKNDFNKHQRAWLSSYTERLKQLKNINLMNHQVKDQKVNKTDIEVLSKRISSILKRLYAEAVVGEDKVLVADKVIPTIVVKRPKRKRPLRFSDEKKAKEQLRRNQAEDLKSKKKKEEVKPKPKLVVVESKEKPKPKEEKKTKKAKEKKGIDLTSSSFNLASY
jgi:hypothetical protein